MKETAKVNDPLTHLLDNNRSSAVDSLFGGTDYHLATEPFEPNTKLDQTGDVKSQIRALLNAELRLLEHKEEQSRNTPTSLREALKPTPRKSTSPAYSKADVERALCFIDEGGHFHHSLLTVITGIAASQLEQVNSEYGGRLNSYESSTRGLLGLSFRITGDYDSMVYGMKITSKQLEARRDHIFGVVKFVADHNESDWAAEVNKPSVDGPLDVAPINIQPLSKARSS